MLVSMKAAGPSMERSTWLSAAKCIDRHDLHVEFACQEADDGGADEAGAAGDEDLHHAISVS
jgi:hypothetical protein